MSNFTFKLTAYSYMATPHKPATEAMVTPVSYNIPESMFASNLNQTESDYTNSLSVR